MNQQLQDRLNRIPDKITSHEFLNSEGLGNELGFWIFDYAPEDELQVREYLHLMRDRLERTHTGTTYLEINLLHALTTYLDQRGFLDKAARMQETKGDQALLKALAGPLHMDKFAPFLVDHYQTERHDVVLLTGVGSAWPLLRAHELLNKLHALLDHKPLVLFYPGHYSGQSMRLFDRISSKNYYRAFRLVP